MKKLLFFFTTVLCLLTPLCTNAFTIEYDGEAHEYTAPTCRLMVDGELIDTPDMPPLLMKDRTLVPIRELCEALGAVVSYGYGEIMIELEGDIIEMTIDKNETYFNGKVRKIYDGVTPKLINFPGVNPKTMVPVRFIAELLGKQVDFEQSTYTVIIHDASDVLKDPTIISETHSLSSGNKKLTLMLNADADFISDVSSFTLSDPTRVVFDFPGSAYTVSPNTIPIDDSPISAIRFGYDGNRTRVVVDVSGKLTSFDAVQNGRYTTITVAASEAPASTPSPTKKPTTSDDDSGKKPVTSEKPTTTTTPTPTPTTKPTTTTVPTSGPVVTPDSYNNLNKKIIVIDAGHGGSDPGAVSEVLEDKTVNEKDITLSIALKVRDILEDEGYTVVMTRASDTYPTLNERAELANRTGAAVFVSIHMNSSPSADPSGTETYYSEINNGDDFGAKSSELAKNIQDRLYKALGSTNRGVKTANHAVTRNSLMPAVLVEVGFISNADQAKLLTTASHQNKAANAIAEGIIVTWDDITMPKNWDNLAIERVEALK